MLDDAHLDLQDPMALVTCWDDREPTARDEPAHRPNPATLDLPLLPRLRVTVEIGDLEAATFFYACVLAQSGTRVSAGRHDFDLGTEVVSIRDQNADGGAVDWPPNHRTVYATTTESLDDVRRRAASARARFDVCKGGLSHEPWGTRAITFRDPWHNTVCIVARGAKFRAPRRVWQKLWLHLAAKGA